MKPRAIIFDMDGLLVDSEAVWLTAETEMVESRGHPYSEQVRAQIVGMRMDEFLVKLDRIYGFGESIDSLYRQLTDRMLELIPYAVKAKPGANELLAYVVEQDIPRALASSSPTSIIDAIVDNAGWGSLFSIRCSADDDASGKPAPDVYLRAARLLNVHPSDCLALEDSPNGARAAVAAGMTCYAVPDPSHTRRSAFDGITGQVFKDLCAVLDELTRS